MRWLVLSDLHLKFGNNGTNMARNELCKFLEEKKKKDGNLSFILVTGDCMYKHESKKMEDDVSFVKQIADSCGVSHQDIVLCAGNHDVDIKNRNRNRKIEEIRKSGQLYEIGDLEKGYGDFKTFHLGVTGRYYEHFSTKEIGNCRIITIDSTLLSMGKNDIGNLGVCFQDISKLEDEIKPDGKFNIVIMHHGIHFLMTKDAKEFQYWLVSHKVDMVFCGHSHSVELDILTEAISEGEYPQDGIPQFTCGAGIYDHGVVPSFYICEIDHDNVLKVELYLFRESSRWVVGKDLLRSFQEGVYRQQLRKSHITDGGKAVSGSDAKNVTCYDTIFDAGSDVAKDLENSDFLDFLGMRGGTFLKGNSKIANVLYEKKDIRTRILVSYPYCDRIEERLKMVPEFKKRENLEKQWRIIFQDIGRLMEDIKELQHGEIRFHEQPLLYRFIITSNALYFGFYEEKKSSLSKMCRYNADTVMYKNFKGFFENLWNCSQTNYPAIIPQKYSFLQEKFDMMPSLVINLTSQCNMVCEYCPEGGENLKKVASDEVCPASKIKMLMECFMEYCEKQHWKEKKVIRITGGEPLLEAGRLKEILEHAKQCNYQKIVLCTNGILLKEVYEANIGTWEKIKDILLLKISLDTLKSDVFKDITKKEECGLKLIKDNIEFIKGKGFKIELNLVVTKKNVGEIEEIYNYAKQIGLVGVKVLTVNDFGGLIGQDDLSNELQQLLTRMRDQGYYEKDLYVHNNKGILMKRFVDNNCTLTIVDHMNMTTSITPRRTYSQVCKKCKFYPDSELVKSGAVKPCATGIMSLTMRADGVLSFCRLQTDDSNSIAKAKKRAINQMVKQQMENFRQCYHYNMWSGGVK